MAMRIIQPTEPPKPVRQNVKTVDTDEVMGAGSWIKIRSLTVGENNQFVRAFQSAQALYAVEPLDMVSFAALEDEMRAIICGALLDWNWVDSDGEYLPSPHNNPALMDQLTQEEMSFLMECVRFGPPEKKSSKKKTSR
jgi:hypothetical protein